MKKGLIHDVPLSDVQNIKNEIERIGKEIRDIKRNKFQFKDSAIQNLSFMKAMDGLSSEIKTNLDEVLIELK